MKHLLENQSKAYLKMKKKREAKRQAKQTQDVEDLSNNKQSAIKTIEEPKDNEKLLRIKKIQSVCFIIIVIQSFVNY